MMQDAAPLEAEYQWLRTERREPDRAYRDTAFAKAFAIDRLRRLADRHGCRDRIARVIAEAAAVVPAARPLEAVELYKAVA